MIQIDNLSPVQMVLADKLWEMDSQEQIHEWFLELPDELKYDAYLVLKLIVLAVQDQEAEEDLSQAQAVIARVQQM